MYRLARTLAYAAAFLLASLSVASAQTPVDQQSADVLRRLDYQIGNFVSLEQVVTIQQFENAIEQASQLQMDPVGSSSLIQQSGNDNSASSFIISSGGAATRIAQVGNENTATAVILGSPGSAISQLQVGRGNASLAGIIGGANNSVATVQLGMSLGISVALVDSTGTKVVYDQKGENYNGGIVIRNAPDKTVVKLN